MNSYAIGNSDDNIRLALDFLVKTQNEDGGWGYKVGGQSFTEATAMALLALFHPIGGGKSNPSPVYAESIQKGLLRLRSDNHSDGGWGIFKDDPFSSWHGFLATWVFNVLLKVPELVTLYSRPEDPDIRNRARGWILSKGREPRSSDKDAVIIKKLFSIDGKIIGFKWGPNSEEAGFVMPTAMAIIALTVEDRLVVADSDVVRESKAYLRNRACPVGGWNIGNPFAYDKQLPPTPDGTSYGLLAFAISLSSSDFGQTTEVLAAVSTLADFVDSSNSDQTVALGTLALRFFPDVGNNTQDKLNAFYNKLRSGRATKDDKPKTTGQTKDGGWANSPFATSLAVLALSDNLYFFDPK